MTKQRRLAYLALTLCIVLWGVAPALVKLALPFTTPFRWLFYRYLFAAPLMLPVLIYYAIKLKPNFKQILTIIGLELLGTTAVLSLFYWGLNFTTAIEATLIYATAPFFITLAGIIFLKEKEESFEWIGLILAFTGATVIALEPLVSQSATLRLSLLGNSLILLQNLAWAIYLILVKKAYKNLPKLFVNSLAFWVGFISFGIISLLEARGPLLADLLQPQVLTASLYMAIFGSIAGATLYLYGNNKIEASEASLFNYLEPLISIPLAIWWLQEKLTLSAIIGMALITLGVFWAERRPASPAGRPKK